jgi:hypothetical protein
MSGRELDVLSISPETGCNGEGIDGRGNAFSVSGMGRSEENFSRVKVGGWIIDKRPVEGFASAVMRAPLLDLRLAPNEISRLTSRDIADSFFAQAVLSDPGNGFGQLIRHEQADSAARPERKFGSLDSVGLGHYLDYWRGRGARIGRVTDGGVEWEAA